MERITDNVNPTPDEVREWGYDEDLYLMEQDEDLLLYRTSHAPVLLELAADPSCPKRYYALCILGQFARGLGLAGNVPELCRLLELTGDEGGPRDAGVAQWRAYAGHSLRYHERPSPVSAAEAELTAHDLLLGGAGRVGAVESRPSAGAGAWHFALVTNRTRNQTVIYTSGSVLAGYARG